MQCKGLATQIRDISGDVQVILSGRTSTQVSHGITSKKAVKRSVNDIAKKMGVVAGVLRACVDVPVF